MHYVNVPLYCDDCVHCRYVGQVNVGSDKTGGGPEPSYKCLKYRNMMHYWYHDLQCPDYDCGEDFCY